MDLVKPVATIRGDDAFRPLADDQIKLARRNGSRETGGDDPRR